MTKQYVLQKLNELEDKISKMSSQELKEMVRKANVSTNMAEQYSSLEAALTSDLGCSYVFEDVVTEEAQYAASNDYSYSMAA